MGVIIGATDALTGDYYSTWGKLRTAIVGQDSGSGIDVMTLGAHNIEYLAGGGFLTDNDTPLRFDMRYDSTTWYPGFYRPRFTFLEEFAVSTGPGWYGSLFIASPSLTNEDIAELTGETVVASGTIGTFTMTSDFFSPRQLIQAGSGFTPPYPVEQPIFSVGKLNAF
jgi:hypothetical protein